MPKTNKVFITIDSFNAIGGDQNWTTAEVTLQPRHDGKISQNKTNKYLEVSGKTEIQFTFNRHDRSPDPDYVPAGISFKSTSGGSDPVGESNFPQILIETETIPGGKETLRTMTLSDSHKNHPSTWEFNILLQRVSDAALGIIDPKIRNV